MFIELIDLLRCPVEHEETWLVAAFDRIEDRFVIEGRLGCPICNATYEIVDGIAQFAPQSSREDNVDVSDEDVIRVAALLDLTRPDSLAVLCGSEARLANRVSEMTQSRVIALNPGCRIEETELVSAITSDARIPLATASVDAIAIGTGRNLLKDAARILKPASRITAVRGIDLGPEFSILAQDDRNTVGQLNSPVIQLSRRRLS